MERKEEKRRWKEGMKEYRKEECNEYKQLLEGFRASFLHKYILHHLCTARNYCNTHFMAHSNRDYNYFLGKLCYLSHITTEIMDILML